jgi:probable addiction module antidote protein
MKKKVFKAGVSYDDYLKEKLKDPVFAIGYLKETLAQKDMPEVFLLALRDVVEARGVSKIAKKAALNRQNLYRILSKKGNPRFSSLYGIVDALGLNLSLEEKKAS